MFVGLSVGLSAFYRPHDICPLCGAASEWPREQEPSRAAPRAARASMHLREHARTCRTTSQRKNRTLMPFKNKTVRARIMSYLPRFSKRKPTCHFPSSVYSLPPLGVFTFRIVLNRILHKSSLLAPMESRRTRRPSFTAEERQERRREKDRRRHAERRAGERREQTQARRDVDRMRSSQLETQQLLDDLQRIQS